MVRSYSDLDTEEKIAKAITAHYEGYYIESFTILFEVIKYELSHLIDFTGHGEFDAEVFNWSYRELTLFAEKEEILHYRGILDLHLFRFYRNQIIHTIVNKNKIDLDLLNIWFDIGRIINQRISRMTTDIFFTEYYDLKYEDPLNFY